MLNIIRDSLLQLALLSTLIFSFQVIFAERIDRNRNVKFLFSGVLGLSILLCMSFPIYITPLIHTDFRLVPLLLATFYGGPGYGLFLSVFIIAYRLFLGGGWSDPGLYTTAVTLLLCMPVLIHFRNMFMNAKKKKRIQMVLMLSVYYNLVGIITAAWIIGFNSKLIQDQLLLSMLVVLAIPLLTYLNETLRDMIRRNQRLQSEVKEAEIAFLRSQIKPHFLYNALNSIAALSLDEPRKAKELIYDLSQYLRSGFNFKQMGSLTTIENELELVKAYINIEKARFGARLGVEYNVEANLDILIPPLILQPLVENAIRHGLMSNLRGGTVKISVKQEEDDAIRIAIEDNGCGMSERQRDEILKPNADKTGIGLWNINQRIRLLYGTSLRIETAEGIGTKVILDIPGQPVQQMGG
jgi:sensor histidine kinase YesM